MNLKPLTNPSAWLTTAVMVVGIIFLARQTAWGSSLLNGVVPGKVA